MKFSAWMDNPWPQIAEVAQHCEQTGYEGLWISDHFMPTVGNFLDPWHECWTTLAALAAVVPRLTIGSLVSGNTLRHPAVLAKQVAEVDNISGGRCILGIGSGYFTAEHEAYGLHLGTIGERHRRLVEAVQIIRSLFKNDRTTFDGRYYQLKDAPLAPKPVQDRLPFLISGRGEKVMLGIVAEYADAWNVTGRPEDAMRVAHTLDEHCERIGQTRSILRSSFCNVLLSGDPEEIARAKQGPVWTVTGIEEARDVIGRYQEAGFGEFMVLGHFWGSDTELLKQRYTQFMEEVAPFFKN